MPTRIRTAWVRRVAKGDSRTHPARFSAMAMLRQAAKGTTAAIGAMVESRTLRKAAPDRTTARRRIRLRNVNPDVGRLGPGSKSNRWTASYVSPSRSRRPCPLGRGGTAGCGSARDRCASVRSAIPPACPLPTLGSSAIRSVGATAILKPVSHRESRRGRGIVDLAKASRTLGSRDTATGSARLGDGQMPH